MSTSAFPATVFEFYRLAEKLKLVMRHSWLSDGQRRESVAEHTWMMSLLALILMPKVKLDLDQTKVLKMIAVHDLAEAVTEDMPVWDGVVHKEEKAEAERKAMELLLKPLPDDLSTDLLQLWEEYEQRTSPEALFVKALDTLDVIAQHNTTDLHTWDDNDYLWQLSPLQDSFFDLDEILRQLKDQLDQWSISKVNEAGRLDKLDQVELQKRQARNSQ
ncbi:HD domain-containing protein [Patescibacteria group bacterium]|nr:HD domain-containing protein [Patescibacteria group bacterium]